MSSSESWRPVKLASAAVVATMRAEEPEMPAPAGDSEWVSRVKPPSGAKKRTRFAAKGWENFLALQNSSTLAKESDFPVSSDFSSRRVPEIFEIWHRVSTLTAKLTVTAPE